MALDQLGVEMHEVENIEILDEGSKGFFGLGARPVRVKVSVKRALHQARQGGDRNRDRRERGAGPERQERGQQGQRPDRPDRGPRPERQDRGQQGQQRQARPDRGPRPDRPAQGERRERGQDGARTDGPPRGEQRGGGDRNERGRRGGRERGGRPGQGGPQQRRENEPRRQKGQAARPPREPRPERSPRPEAPDSEPGPGGEGRAFDTPAPEFDTVPMTDEQGREAAALLQDVIGKMGIEAQVEYKRDADGSARLDVASPDSALLIGRKGRNLQAMQYIINRIIARADSNEVSERLLVDIEGYVDRRRASLEELAQHLAERAKATGRDVHLKPLSPQERRVVHLTLQGDPDVRTFSIGDTLHRIVVISPKNRRGGGGGRGRGPRREDRYPEPRPVSDEGGHVDEAPELEAPARAAAVAPGNAPAVVMPAVRAKRPPVKRRRGLRPLRYGPNAAQPAEGSAQPAAPASANDSGEPNEG